MTSPRPTSKIFTIKKEVILINFFVVGAIFASVFTRYDSFPIPEEAYCNYYTDHSEQKFGAWY